MSNQTESFDVIQQLKKDDIILRPADKEKYRIAEIGDDFFILTLLNERRILKMIRFSDLISENWEIEIEKNTSL